MKKQIACIITALALPHFAHAEECTMKSSPIDIQRIARNSSVKSQVIANDKSSLTVLLKNGRTFKLVHMGCQHSGASVSLWLDSSLSLSDTAGWAKEITELLRIAFPPDIAKDIITNLKSKNFDTTSSESRVVISASPNKFFNYSVVISSAEDGFILKIDYSLG